MIPKVNVLVAKVATGWPGVIGRTLIAIKAQFETGATLSTRGAGKVACTCLAGLVLTITISVFGAINVGTASALENRADVLPCPSADIAIVASEAWRATLDDTVLSIDHARAYITLPSGIALPIGATLYKAKFAINSPIACCTAPIIVAGPTRETEFTILTGSVV